jgi:hypothetical protein
MRKTLLTSAAVLGFALSLPAFAQTATDPNPANPSAIKDGTPAAGTGSGAAPGMDPAASGKTGATLGNQAPSQGPGPLGEQANPGASSGQNNDSGMGAPAASSGSSGMNNPSSASQTESAPSDQGTATPPKPRHRSMSSNSGMGGGSGHWAHQPGTGESGPASSQASNIDSADTHGVIAPHLPQPKVGENAGPDGYLRAADRALAAHKTGAAQQALEMAETRLLDRSTAPGVANEPDQNPRIAAVTAARKALASKDWQGARKSIQEAMNNGGTAGDNAMSSGSAPSSGSAMSSDSGMSSGSMSSGNSMSSGASSGQMQNGMNGSGALGVANGNPGATPAPMDPTGSNPTNGAAGTSNPGPATTPNPMAPANGAK